MYGIGDLSFAHYTTVDEQDENEELNAFNQSSLFNMTCPPLRSNQTFDFNQSMQRESKMKKSQDPNISTTLNESVMNALVSHDPRVIPDDLREVIVKQKRISSTYKTALCESYRRTKTCPYNDTCRFAHGVEELRMPGNARGKNHPKYKTMLCEKFSTTGECRYGARCQFIHKIANPALVYSANKLIEDTLSEMEIPQRAGNNSMMLRNEIGRGFARDSGHRDAAINRFVRSFHSAVPMPTKPVEFNFE
ncbi:unnamed protein product [Caenorhabditis bovis]|uniref:C3H1-type domain-containing protein n=1 Tax=Caenorhabditis bovis TaxID=2654633 RepID=A0A8S1EUS0_9PELO|nr:unnamed protein product [Caenorhabditis bovis]